MKKILALVLVLMLLCSMLAACGGSKEPAAASAAPSGASSGSAAKPAAEKPESKEADGEEEEADGEEEEAGSDDVTDEYVEIMNGFIDNFEGLMGSLGELLALSDSIASEDDLMVWCDTFDNIKAIAGASADELANVAAHVPQEYAESHAAITIAVAAVYDGMTGFEDAVVGAVSGDADAFETGIVEFVANIAAAEELWNSAIEQ